MEWLWNLLAGFEANTSSSLTPKTCSTSSGQLMATWPPPKIWLGAFSGVLAVMPAHMQSKLQAQGAAHAGRVAMFMQCS